MASKYGNRKTTYYGVQFDSKKEADRYLVLRDMQNRGEISELILQPEFNLHAGIKYIADFEYIRNGKKVVEDVKGMKTPVYRLKKKLFLADYGKYLDFREV